MQDLKQSPEKEFIYVPVPQKDKEQNEIDLLELWDTIWNGKWFIMGFTLFCTLVAVFVTLFVMTVMYKSDTVLQPTETTPQSGLSALAANLPISIPGTGGDRNVNIVSFLKSRTIKQRLIEKYNLLPKFYSDMWDPEAKRWMVDAPENAPTILKAVQKKFDDIYLITYDEKKTGLITITWIDEDPEFTKLMLDRTVQELKYFLENEYESDAKRERIFVESRLNESEKELEYWEKQVPSENLTLSKIQRERVAVQTVYTELKKQLELAKISEVKEIIRFKVLDEAFVPEQRFKPKRTMICALTIVTSGFFSISMLFFVEMIKRKKTK